MSRIDWDTQPLGEMPDHELAEQLGVTLWAVQRARAVRGIPRMTLRRQGCPDVGRKDRVRSQHLDAVVDWDAQPLGEVNDTELARRLGVAPATVWRQRTARGIPPRGRVYSTDHINWDAQPLGDVSDAEIARRLGCFPGTVSHRRKERGIPPHAPKSRIDWDAQPLGVVTDADLSRRLGVSESAVREQRAARGIPTASLHHVDWHAQPLGKMSDPEMARRLGVAKGTVYRWRKRLGIPPWRPGQ